MKIERVTLENFGIYTRKVLTFDAAPLVLIYGPNESGKTTALNGLRQALFGFEMRTPYLTGRTMSAEVSGRLANDNLIEFSRRKSKQDEVIGTLAGRNASPEELLQALCNLDLASYKQLFGFSLDELREGEAALKSARLSEALAGGGLGGMHALQELRAELQLSLMELYKSRGSTSKINLKLADIQKSHESLRASQVLPTAVEELQQELSDMKLQSDRERELFADVLQARSAAERLRDALPKFRQRCALERQLSNIELPSGVDMSFVSQWSSHADQRQKLLDKLDEEQVQLQRDRAQLAQLGGSQEISASEGEIEHLGHQASEISASRHRLQELREQIDDARGICQRLLETLELADVNDDLRKFSVSPPKKAELQKRCREYVTNAEETIAVTARLEAAVDSLAAIESNVEPFQQLPENLLELASFVERLQKLERELLAKSETLQKFVDDRELHDLQTKLLNVVGQAVTLAVTWRLPSAMQVQQQQHAEEELRRELTTAKRHVAKLDKEYAIAQEQIETLDQRSADELISKATTNRVARDAIIDQWLDDLSQPLIAASISPEDQRDRLRELQRLATAADVLQSEVFAAAEALAQFNQRQQHIERLQKEILASQKQLDELSMREQSLQREWQLLWKDVPFEASTCEVMLAWLHDYARWIDLYQQGEQLRRDVHIARGLVRHERRQLQDHWPNNLRDDVSTEVLTGQIRQWESLRHDMQRDRERLVGAKVNVDKLQTRLGELQQQHERIASNYAQWLSAVPITLNWPLEQVSKLIDTLEHLRREDESQRRATQQVCELEQQLDAYDSRVRDLAKTMGQVVGTGSLEGHAERWLNELLAMRHQRTQRIQLNAAIEHRARTVMELTAQQVELDKKLATLCSTVNDDNPTAMGALVERVRRAESIRVQISELTASIEPHSANEPLGEFLARLQSADEVTLQLQIEELSREAHRLDESRKLADQSIGALTQRIEQLANNQAAQRNQQALQDQRGELAELAEQWVVQRLAQELLNRSIERFAADHEPALLMYTRDYLKKLTGGRYVSVEHDNAKLGSFVVRNARDEPYTPDQLSTGTREQLYLAIRMAYITHHSEHHEPLPVIMDDCFVNFDDTRTRHALEAIVDWDPAIQTILLSCHWRVVQSLAEFAPQTAVIHLEKDLHTTAGELVLCHSS